MIIYPGVDVSYHPTDRLKFFASYNTSLRLPSFTEMYYKLQGYAADPHLKPEEMQAIEAGTSYHDTFIDAKATIYHHHGKDMIDWIMDTNQGQQAQWQSVNHTKVNSIGIEANVGINLARCLSLDDHRCLFNISYSYIHQDKDLEAGIVSQYALEYLRHKLIGSLQTDIWRQLSLRLNCRWQDRVGSYTNFDGEVKEYSPYMLMDARLQWEARRYVLYTEVNNLLDNRSYVDFGNVPQPGIWVVAGLRVKL